MQIINKYDHLPLNMIHFQQIYRLYITCIKKNDLLRISNDDKRSEICDIISFVKKQQRWSQHRTLKDTMSRW